MDISVEEQRLIIEIIATLVNIKTTMINLILKPAGVPRDLYESLFKQRDPITGQPLSKRKAAPLIIDGLQNHPNKKQIMRSIIRIAASWTDFSLAHNEYEARATVQKAQEVLKHIEEVETREQIEIEIAYQAEVNRRREESRIEYKKETDILLLMFDDLCKSENFQQRGYLLQDLLNRLFLLHEIPVYKSFTRNQGGEQIDGAFILDSWYYLVECRWRKDPADIRQLDGLSGQVERSGKQTYGLFLSMNGWSENVVPVLKQNPNKSIILMDGYDLRCVLAEIVDLQELLHGKIAHLNLAAEPFLSAKDYLETNQ